MVDYKMVDGVSMQLTTQEQNDYDSRQTSWPAQQSSQLLISNASVALSKSDETMLRIQEAISLGLTTWTATDVIAWTNYRRSLREIINSQNGAIPNKPAYPANT